MSNKAKIYTIVGNRPQFIKVDPELPGQRLIHTGQHYDHRMSQVFFEQLGLPSPHVNLGCKSSAGGRMFDRLRALLLKDRPALVVVDGDTLSTLMGTLAASYARIPVVHLEAGARSGELSMPEEVNRLTVDRLASARVCFTMTCFRNLNEERLANHSYYLKGDPLFDAMNRFLPIKRTKEYRQYALLTIHRDFNADSRERLSAILGALGKTKERFVFPVHPRTAGNLAAWKIKAPANVEAVKPVSYREMLSLESNARKIVTDSGGIQREAYWMRIPCVTLREETEWAETVRDGWSVLVGADPGRIRSAVDGFNPDARQRQSEMPVFGVNKKIREIIAKYL